MFCIRLRLRYIAIQNPLLVVVGVLKRVRRDATRASIGIG
jgi:hypothetical protein